MTSLNKSDWVILIGLLLLCFVPVIGGLFRLTELTIGTKLEFLPSNPRTELSPAPVVFHLISSVIYSIFGAFQFLSSIRKRHPNWHRLSGRMLICTGIVSSVSGLWMTHFYAFPESLQGSLLYQVRMLVGVSMVTFILFGISAVRQRKIAQHQAWMIRAYALGLGAGTQVLIAIPWLLTHGEPTGMTRDVLMTTAWIVNITVAEYIIKNQRIRLY